jgi:hypothetical protein
MTRKLFVLIVATLFFSASATLAGPLVRKDKGASNNGVAEAFNACKTSTTNCGNFGPSSGSVDGAAIVPFITNDGMGTTTSILLLDVFQIPGTIVAGNTLMVNFVPSTNPIDFGIFSCENGSGGAVGPSPIDGSTTALDGPCTVGTISDLENFFGISFSGDVATLTFKNFGAIAPPTAWTFDTDPGELESFKVTSGGTNPTPEPGSASLLFVGALAAGLVALKARR